MRLSGHDQTSAPFVTWRLHCTPLKSREDRANGRLPFGTRRASNQLEVRLDWVEMKILDSLGMKYTHLIFGLLALLTAFACTAPAFAQAQAYSQHRRHPQRVYRAVNADDTQAGALLTIHKRVDEVNVLFIATDKHGKFVRDLNQNDFSILDDHKPPQSNLNFRRETDLPLQLGLLVDMSGSVRGRFHFEQDAAIGFLQHTVRAKFDKAFVVGFNKQSQMAQDFTDNVQLLSDGVHRMQNGGGTALYDAIYKACKEKFLKDRPERPARKAIIVVSDGEDNQSDVSRAQAIEMAQRAEVIIYAISTDDSGLILRGDKVLRATGRSHRRARFLPLQDERHDALVCRY